jgi:serine/threonine protein kinase
MDNPEADLRRIAEIACGARLADTAPRNIRIPGYTLGPALGAGVDATVYRALLPDFRLCALKVPHIGREVSVSREAGLLSAVQGHPGILELIDAPTDDSGRRCLVVPYIPERLGHRFGTPLTDGATARILSQVLAALEHIHARGFVHGDVKAENIGLDGGAVLFDFGKAHGPGFPPDISDGEPQCSVDIIAPEMVDGGASTPLSDVYAVGVLAFELVTGAMLIAGASNLAELVEVHSTKPTPRVAAAAAHWQPLLDRALTKNPAERFQSAAEMLSAVEAVHGR